MSFLFLPFICHDASSFCTLFLKFVIITYFYHSFILNIAKNNIVFLSFHFSVLDLLALEFNVFVLILKFAFLDSRFWAHMSAPGWTQHEDCRLAVPTALSL